MTERKRPEPLKVIDPAGEIAAAAAGAQEAPDLTGGHDPADRGGAGDAFDVKEIPPDWAITPLGFLKQRFYFLDFAGQLIDLGSEFRKGELMALYGTRMALLDERWPQWKKIDTKRGEPPEYERDGFSQKDAQQAHILACSKRRLFDPKRKVRGRGAHRGDGGELVLHCGNAVIVGGRKGVRGRARGSARFKSGEVGGYIYPTLEAIAEPADDPASVEIGHTILACLETWNWQVKGVAPYLMFCWIAAALLGGALRIRPHGWIVGPSGAGKTTLQDFLRELMGEWGIFTEDATEAGVRQSLDQDTLAVMFDEIEAEEDNREVVAKIVRLARLAYSGASALRGTSEQTAKQFVARSCFLFSSIHHHELPAQDRNRIAILALSQLPGQTEKFAIPPSAREWGQQLRRRLIEQWARFDDTLLAYQHEMFDQGYSGREQDTYGTLLACGDLLLHEAAPDSERAFKQVRALAAIVSTARAEAIDISDRCVRHLASHRLPATSGAAQETIAQWLAKLLVKIHLGEGDGRDAIKKRLGTHGLRVVHLDEQHEGTQGGLIDAYTTHFAAKAGEERGKPVPMWLAVANKTNKGVQEIFEGSTWKGGVWGQSLSLVKGAFVNKKARFGGGSAEGCVLVPLAELVDIDAAIEEADRAR